MGFRFERWNCLDLTKGNFGSEKSERCGVKYGRQCQFWVDSHQGRPGNIIRGEIRRGTWTGKLNCKEFQVHLVMHRQLPVRFLIQGAFSKFLWNSWQLPEVVIVKCIYLQINRHSGDSMAFGRTWFGHNSLEPLGLGWRARGVEGGNGSLLPRKGYPLVLKEKSFRSPLSLLRKTGRSPGKF